MLKEKRIYREIDGDRVARYMETMPFYHPETAEKITDVGEYMAYFLLHAMSGQLAAELFLLTDVKHKNLMVEMQSKAHRDGHNRKFGLTLILKYAETP